MYKLTLVQIYPMPLYTDKRNYTTTTYTKRPFFQDNLGKLASER